MNLKGRGKEAFTARELIAVHFPNQVTKDGKTSFLDIQMNAEGLAKDEHQANLHLATSRREVDGKQYINNTVGYSAAQFDEIKKAAGDNVVTLESGATVYGFKGDLMAKKGSHLLVNTKTLAPSELTIDENVLSKQAEVAKAAKEAVKNEPVAETAPTGRTRKSAPAVNTTEPSVEPELEA